MFGSSDFVVARHERHPPLRTIASLAFGNVTVFSSPGDKWDWLHLMRIAIFSAP
jgi:hypothetical protein